MSRIGLKPIEIPNGVEISVNDKNVVSVKGPKGELKQAVDPRFVLKVEEGVASLARPNDAKEVKAKHGLYRSLIADMVEGVSQGFSKKLKITGTGYRAAKQGNTLVLNIGFSHPVKMAEPEGITIDVPDETTIVVNGIDKQAVGDLAAKIREVRPPEPYKGKGIRYDGEYIRRKVGKTAE